MGNKSSWNWKWKKETIRIIKKVLKRAYWKTENRIWDCYYDGGKKKCKNFKIRITLITNWGEVNSIKLLY